MPTLAEMSEAELGIAAAVHLLLCGPSKVGKTRYITEWVKDGGTCFYVDNDNGLNTLKKALEHDKAALARVVYLPTQSLFTLMQYLFAGRKILHWNLRTDSLYSPSAAQPTDRIFEIKIASVPFGVLWAFDSWSSASMNLLADGAQKNSVSMEDFGEQGQKVYGDANRRANLLCSLIQSSKHNIVVQAHVDFYDRMEKPKGLNKPKASEMIVKENIQIPYSVSRPHGFTMPKYFNEVGWMRVKTTGAFVLDYRQMHDRVGGGTLMAEGNPNEEFRLSRTLIPIREVDMDWHRTITAEELKAESPPPPAPAAKAANPTAPAQPAGVLKSGGLLSAK
jgi:hypothetical protein